MEKTLKNSGEQVIPIEPDDLLSRGHDIKADICHFVLTERDAREVKLK